MRRALTRASRLSAQAFPKPQVLNGAPLLQPMGVSNSKMSVRNPNVRMSHSPAEINKINANEEVLDAFPGHKDQGLEVATLAAGCFWSVQLVYQREPGVISTAVGYTAGDAINPSYHDVCNGISGHTEAVQFTYDPKILSYERILDIFWNKHDPTTLNRQGNDWGTQYRSGVYTHGKQQHEIALKSRDQHQEKLGDRKIVTEVEPARKFYLAEAVHQKYLEKGGQCARKGSKIPIRCYG